MDLMLLTLMHFELKVGAGAYEAGVASGTDISPAEQQRANYDAMVRTWYEVDQQGNPQPPPPSFEECIAAWPEFARSYNAHMRLVQIRHREGKPITDKEEHGLYPIFPYRGGWGAAYLYEDPFAPSMNRTVSSDDLE